jgi:hypothetical protein
MTEGIARSEQVVQRSGWRALLRAACILYPVSLFHVLSCLTQANEPSIVKPLNGGSPPYLPVTLSLPTFLSVPYNLHILTNTVIGKHVILITIASDKYLGLLTQARCGRKHHHPHY